MKRSRYPRPMDINLVRGMLTTNIPTDSPLREGWRESLNHVPNYRLQGLTQQREWLVDVYAGMHLVVTVSGRGAEICDSVPTMVNYLRRMLRL